MDKDILLHKIKEKKYTHEQLLSWVGSLPAAQSKRKPSKYKVGDVLMHPIFNHPYVLLEQKNSVWICGLITSESKCPEILEECRSRFFETEQYFTKTLFSASEIVGSWVNNYENIRHLKKVYKKLKELL